MLREANYDEGETKFLVNGFRESFDIGYRGPETRRSTSKNIPFTVGNKYILWEKIMAEVKEKRFAGPFSEVPFENFIQSPIGLVPKKGKNKTRLIFHLSYNFVQEDSTILPSVNACTLKEWCSVKYNDLDTAVKQCILMSKKAEFVNGVPIIYLGKTDLSNAFRVLTLKRGSICLLVLKAEDPRDGIVKYFIDLWLPFGASISCSHYQRFSNRLKAILQHRSKHKAITNYLDDFLFITIFKHLCDELINCFIDICNTLGVPIAMEKMEWGDTLVIFLGILLDGKRLCLSLPLEKREKALRLLNDLTGKCKVTIKTLQVLTGYLNFLTKAIFPGRTFTRRMYSKCTSLGFNSKGVALKPHHHIYLDEEFRFDCEIWRIFLMHYRDLAVCRPMVDVDKSSFTATQLKFYSDTSGCEFLGVGAVFEHRWFFAKWEPGFIRTCKPSIQYLELFGVIAAILTWGDQIQNMRMVLFCDNESVVEMVNNQCCSCWNCMYLLRLLTLNNLVNNRRVFTRHLRSEENYLSDALSRLQLERFWRLAPMSMNKELSRISPLVWPASKIWIKTNQIKL